MPLWLLALVGAVVVVSAIVYWLVVLTEGAYLGSRTVTALYDRVAGRYDQIKQFVDADEDYFLGRPIARFLAGWTGPPDPWLLDVATGTGRLPLAVLRARAGRCQVIALDSSAAMLQQAEGKLRRHGWGDVLFLAHDVGRLPFADAQFPVVACLEALEFLPDPAAALADLLRVTRPGGLLVLSNRIGHQARLMPGRTFSRDQLSAELRRLGAGGVEIMPWQMDYDLVFAIKQGEAGPAVDEGWPALLQCPRCASQPAIDGAPGQERLVCATCHWQLALRQSIWRQS
jgi:ubiquinone/menaquinone biosynthesis C-methylase UbiE